MYMILHKNAKALQCIQAFKNGNRNGKNTVMLFLGDIILLEAFYSLRPLSICQYLMNLFIHYWSHYVIKLE